MRRPRAARGLLGMSALAVLATLGTGVARAETVNCTPITSAPFSIVTPGVYCLTGNLDHAGTGAAIST
jgi:hypothetical protein